MAKAVSTDFGCLLLGPWGIAESNPGQVLPLNVICEKKKKKKVNEDISLQVFDLLVLLWWF